MREKKKLVTHKKMKHDTLMQIIDAVRMGYNTKKSIQQKVHFSWGTCSEGINYLENIHILTSESQLSGSQAGPRSNIYSINQNRNLIMGIEVSVGRINCTVSSLDGLILNTSTLHYAEELDNFSIYRILRDAFFQTLEQCFFEEDKIYAVGFALTGALDRNRMMWIRSPMFKNIENLEFHTFYSHFPQVKHIYISHDVQCRAMDITFTNHGQKNDFIMLHVSEGVGTAAYENGNCICGHRGLAGEIGHIPYPGTSLISGSPCFCGNERCLETFLKQSTLLNYYNEQNTANVTSLADIDMNSIGAESLYVHLEKLLLYTCVILVNIFDTSCLVISGKSVDPWINRFKSDFISKLQAVTWEHGPEEIIWIDDRNTNPSHGACLLHLDHFYSDLLNDQNDINLIKNS